MKKLNIDGQIKGNMHTVLYLTKMKAIQDFLGFMITQRNWDGTRIGLSEETGENIKKYMADLEEDKK